MRTKIRRALAVFHGGQVLRIACSSSIAPMWLPLMNAASFGTGLLLGYGSNGGLGR